MAFASGVVTYPKYDAPEVVRTWDLDDPDRISVSTKPVRSPGKSDVIVGIDAVVICATNLWSMHRGSLAGPALDEFTLGERVTVEIHAGGGRRSATHMYMQTFAFEGLV